jgi:hypothetical protein
MNQETINTLINKYKDIEGSKDFILLCYVCLSDKHKQGCIRRFVKGILNQEYFVNGISISSESISNMIEHWGKVVVNKKESGNEYMRELFTLRCLKDILLIKQEI